MTGSSDEGEREGGRLRDDTGMTHLKGVSDDRIRATAVAIMCSTVGLDKQGRKEGVMTSVWENKDLSLYLLE